jgi:acyl-CoA synthetase (AMP-forming)/AMP-acid ligase II
MTSTMAIHQLLDTSARRFSDAPALSWKEQTLSYAKLAQASLCAAHLLRSSGVRRGDRVLVSAADGCVTAAVVYGASRLGAIFIVVHADVRGAQLRHVISDTDAAVLITDDKTTEQEALSSGMPCLRYDGRGFGHASGELADENVLGTDPACFIYTSGSTALPKAVVSTHQQVLFAAEAIQSCLGYRADDIVYCPLPLSFSYGLHQLFLAVLSGAHLYLACADEVGLALAESLRRTGATILTGVPSVCDALAMLLSRTSARVPRLRLLTNAGAVLSPRTMATLRSQLPGLHIQVMYGLTECKRATIMPPDGDLERPGSCGLPLPGTEILIIGETGDPLQAGQTGQIVVRGPHVMSGYWRQPELTALRLPRREGLFPELHTGDYGRFDKDGYLYFTGRRDDLYKDRGVRVSCTEVEAAAQQIDGVSTAVVVPPQGRRGAVLAVVSDLPAKEILYRMREQIEVFKIPRQCVSLAEIPTNGNGKYDRRQLADLLVRAGLIPDPEGGSVSGQTNRARS